MRARVITRARASALLIGGVAACAAPVLAQANTTVRIGLTPLEGAAEPYYAEDMRFFAKVGVTADIQVMQAAPAIAAAIASKAIDIGYSPLDTLANIHQKRIPLVVVAPAAEYLFPNTARVVALVLPANSSVYQAKDLNGKIIASPALHSLAETASRVWIDQNGGDSSTIKFTEVPFPAMPAALEAGRIDAAYVAEPFIPIASKTGRILAYLFEGISKHFIITAWFTTPEWARDHPDLVKRFAAVMHETAVWANGNLLQSGAILAKYTKIDPTVVATMARTRFAELLTPNLMQPLIDVSAKYNGFDTFPAKELIYVP